MIECYFFKSQQIYHQISPKSQMPHPNKETELFHTTGQLTFRCISSVTTCARITCWSACTSNVSLSIVRLNCAAYPNQLHSAISEPSLLSRLARLSRATSIAMRMRITNRSIFVQFPRMKRVDRDLERI